MSGPIRNAIRRLLTPSLAAPIAGRSLRGWLLLGIAAAVLYLLGFGWAVPLVAPLFEPPPARQELGWRSNPQGMATPILGFDPQATQGPDKPEYFGWSGSQAAAKAREVMTGPPPAFRYGPDEWRAIDGKRVILWPYLRAVAPRPPPNIPQPVGDCVSRGWSLGAEFASAVHLYFEGGEFKRVYPPYIYGTSRVQVGGGGLGGDGSVGAWAAKAVEQYGVLEWTSDLPAYEASNIRAWGRSGPPAKYLEKGKLHKAETKLVTSFEAACVSLSHGWAVPVCSSQGFQRIRPANGRIEGVPSGTWYHCMVFIGFDSREGREALYCYNSWGPDAHAPASKYDEMDGAPPGGFWVPKAVAEKMLDARDSYSVSFDGFSRSQYRVLEAFELFSKP